MTGSLQTAKVIIKDLQAFGAVTPFKSSELIETAKRLKAFGVDTEKLVETTKRLGDVAGATGADLKGIATAYGQIQAKGRLQGEELLQLQERGINLQDELQKMYNLTGDEFRKALEKGQFSAEAVELALKNLTDTGGKYAKGAIAQSTTLAGKFSTLQDGIERVAQTLGAVLAPALKNILDLANQAISSINQALAAGSISTEQKQGFKSQAEAEVQRFAGSMPGGPFGAGKVVVRTNGKTYTGNASSVVSQITNDLINQEVKKQTETANAAGAGVVKPVAIGNVVPDLLNKTGGTNGGGASTAAADAQREAETAARQLKSAQDLAFASENQLRLAKEMTDVQKIGEEYAVKRLEIEKEYADKIEDSKSAVETALLQVAEINELKTAEIEKEQALKDLREGAVASIDEEIARLTAKLEGKEKEYLIEKKIAELKAKGVTNAEGKVNELESLRERSAAADELKASYESLAGSISGELTGAFKSIIDGSKTAEEALSDAFAGIADAFLDMAMKMIQQWLQMQIMGMFAGGLGGGGGGMSGMFNLSGGQFGSFSGGGYTGDAPRSGGVDGEGGFPAILHPQETVVDHSGAMSRYGPNNSSGGNGEMAGSEGGTAMPEGPPQINISGGVMQFGGDDFIRKDQLPKIIEQSSKAGEARTMRKLQMNPGARRKVGL